MAATANAVLCHRERHSDIKLQCGCAFGDVHDLQFLAGICTTWYLTLWSLGRDVLEGRAGC